MEGGWHEIGRTPTGVRHFLGASASVAQPRIHIVRAHAPDSGQKKVAERRNDPVTGPALPTGIRRCIRDLSLTQ